MENIFKISFILLLMLLPFFMGCTSIHQSAGTGNLTEIAQYLEKGADVNVRDNKGETPLKWAVAFGQLDATKYLVYRGADMNARNDDGKTPMMLASEKGHQNVAQWLSKKGAVE